MEDIRFFIQGDNVISIMGDISLYPEIIDNLGTTEEDFFEGKIIELDQEQLEYLNENPGATGIEIFNKDRSANITAQINSLVERILQYDSEEINEFFINEEPCWIDKESRVALRSSLEIEKLSNRENTKLWINDKEYTLSITELESLLKEVELYAIDCLSKTKELIAKVKTFTSFEEIDNFSITGYPNKLKFTI